MPMKVPRGADRFPEGRFHGTCCHEDKKDFEEPDFCGFAENRLLFYFIGNCGFCEEE